MSMYVARELSVCQDCLMALANDDYSGISDDARVDAVKLGVVRLGCHAVAVGDEYGFRRSPCECCQDCDPGERYSAAVLASKV